MNTEEKAGGNARVAAGDVPGMTWQTELGAKPPLTDTLAQRKYASSHPLTPGAAAAQRQSAARVTLCATTTKVSRCVVWPEYGSYVPSHACRTTAPPTHINYFPTLGTAPR
jgi:hypothetical protein